MKYCNIIDLIPNKIPIANTLRNKLKGEMNTGKFSYFCVNTENIWRRLWSEQQLNVYENIKLS